MILLVGLSLIPGFLKTDAVQQSVKDTIIATYKHCVIEKQEKLKQEKFTKNRESKLLYEIEWCLKSGVDLQFK